jgi:signal peptidase II
VKILYVSLAVVLTDQISKLLIKGFFIPVLGLSFNGIPRGSSIPIWGDFLRLTYVENPGMAFGIDLGGKIWLALFTLVASIGIFFYLYHLRNERLMVRLAIALVLGGALGNLIDRSLYGVLFQGTGWFQGRVIDYIDIDFVNINLFGYHLTRFFTFNVADSCISIGVVLMLLFHRQVSPKELESSTDQQSPDASVDQSLPSAESPQHQ